MVHQLSAAQGGIAALAGIVDVDSFREHRPTVEALFRSPTVHADGTHPHVHGANLGVRAAPGGGRTPERYARLFDVAEEDTSLAKLAEAHWDALAILREA